MEFFFSHGWLYRAALLLNMCPTGNRLFLAGPDESVGGQCTAAPLPIIERSGGESPAVTLSVCDLGCGLASLWAFAPLTPVVRAPSLPPMLD